MSMIGFDVATLEDDLLAAELSIKHPCNRGERL
jgi:hypothetical protein